MVNSKRLNRYYKMMPCAEFPSAEYTIYHDGNIQMLVDPLKLVNKYLGEHDIAVFAHPDRQCVYAEGKACWEQHKASRLDVETTLASLRAVGYPKDNGLAACWVIIRRNTEQTRQLGTEWFDAYSALPAKRDQLSFDYVCWKLGINYAIIPGNLFKGTSKEFKRYGHVKLANRPR